MQKIIDKLARVKKTRKGYQTSFLLRLHIH